MMAELTFVKVSKINKIRCDRWHGSDSETWSVADWSNAMCGEAGEVANAVKKLRRLQTGVASNNNPVSKDAIIAEIKKEIGDTYLYLDLLAQHLGIDMEKAVRETFNRVSEREGFPERL